MPSAVVEGSQHDFQSGSSRGSVKRLSRHLEREGSRLAPGGTRATLSRILNEYAEITAGMSLQALVGLRPLPGILAQDAVAIRPVARAQENAHGEAIPLQVRPARPRGQTTLGIT